jgi:hypothetical protein
MISIEELKKKFDLLPVSTANWELYQNLLSLDQSVFKPIMEEIIEGRMDIEDTRPIFGKYFPKMVETMRGDLYDAYGKRHLINTPDDLKQNLILRAMAPDRSIREVTLPSSAYEDIKATILTKYEEETGDTLTDSQKKALLIAFDAFEKTDNDMYANKDRQIRLSDMMSGSPS